MNKRIQFFLFFLVISFVILIGIFTDKNINVSENNTVLENTNIEVKNNAIVEKKSNTEIQDNISVEESSSSIMSFALTANNIILPPGSTSTDLQNAVNNAAEGDTIVISNDIQLSEAITTPDRKALSIQSSEGNNWVLYQNKAKTRHFEASGNLTLQNITLDGKGIGGGINANYYCTLTLNSGTIIQNNVAEFGGGVRGWYNSNFNMYDGCIIQNNTANYGGGIFLETHVDIANIYGGEIKNNTSNNDGGGISHSNTINMYSGSISGNKALAIGGGICTSTPNGIFNMNGGTISGNIAELAGGGISTAKNGGIININSTSETCYIIDNKTNNGSGAGISLAVQLSGLGLKTGLNITGTNYISNNVASLNGGGISVSDGSIVNITGNNSISNNIAKSGNGGAIDTPESNYKNINTDKNTIFSENKASKSFVPLVNAGTLYPSIGFASTSIYDHPLNNDDISYTSSYVHVIYDANGGTGSYNGKDTQAGFTDTIVSLIDTGISRQGYTFTGWNTETNGSGTSYKAGDIVTLNSNLTLYAQWKINEYTVGFEDKDGKEIERKVVEYNKPLTKPDDPTKEGYEFDGWYTDKETFLNEWDFNTPVTEDMTLYVKWKVAELVVTFESNGGTHIEEQRVPFDLRVNKPEDPTKQGYTFGGWYTDNKTFLNEWNFNEPVEKSMTLYAKWMADDYTVTFESNGGTPVDSQVVPEGDLATRPANPTRPGYIFRGWYTDNGTFLNEWNFTTPVTEEIILYANWEQSTEEHRIDFDTKGGTPIESQIIPEGGIITKPEDPTKPGYVFDGWYTDDGTFLNEWDFNNPVTEGMQLYVKWKVDVNYILTWIVIVSFISFLAMIICYSKIDNIKKCSNKQKTKRCDK